MYFLCDCCQRPISKGGAYGIMVADVEFCVCELCDLYYGYVMNDKNKEIAKIGANWAGFILEYDMLKAEKKEAFSKMYCRLSYKAEN